MAEVTDGMALRRVREMARQLEAEARVVRSMITQLNSRIETMPWSGEDKDRFVQKWRAEHAEALSRVARGFEAASKDAMESADKQEHTSRR